MKCQLLINLDGEGHLYEFPTKKERELWIKELDKHGIRWGKVIQ